MSNGRDERMVGTIKQGIGRLLISCSVEWDRVMDKLSFGYCQRPFWSGLFTFQLLYEVKPRILPSDHGAKAGVSTLKYCEAKLLAVFGPEATRTEEKRRKAVQTNDRIDKFQVGDWEFVTNEDTFEGPKWPPFKSMFYGPFVVKKANHPLYALISTMEDAHERQFTLAD